MGCAKKPKPWDNPELIKIEREDLPVVFEEVTFFGHVVNKQGQKGNESKIYFKGDGTSEIWVHGMSTFDRGSWDTSNPEATFCNSYQKLLGGKKECRLLYKVKGEDRYEVYTLEGKLRSLLRESRPGYHM